MTTRMTQLFLLLFVSLQQSAANGQTFDERFSDWPLHTFIRGTVVVAPTLSDPQNLRAVLPENAADISVALVTQGNVAPEWRAGIEELLEPPQLQQHLNIPEDQLVAQLRHLLQSVDMLIWKAGADYIDGSKSALDALSDDIQAFMDRKGTLVIAGPHCLLAGQYSKGIGLIPDALLSVASDSGDNDLEKLRTALKGQSQAVGVNLSADAVLILKRRICRVIGEGSVTFMVPKCDWLPERVQVLKQQNSRRQDPNEYLIDLTEWRREAIERTLEPFPPAKPPRPHVENGTLVIVGGGGMPDGQMQQFVELAGGTEQAKLVYIPCTEQEEVSTKQRTVQGWTKMGVQNATHLHTKDRHKANTDDDFLEPLRDATGIWFGGGRQWNMADSWYGTKAHQLMKDVLKRGGVIGGSSAGASIQARYLARATPIQNFRIMAPGYERGGLGFIGGVAIDQHFTQRGRQKDMTALVNRYPQMLGIGIDESTALIVRQSVGEVVGDGKVHFYDRSRPVVEGEPDFKALPSGSSYDLAKRVVLVDTTVEDRSEGDKPTSSD